MNAIKVFTGSSTVTTYIYTFIWVYIPMLRRIILEVGNYKFSFSQISGVLDKWGYSKREIIIS